MAAPAAGARMQYMRQSYAVVWIDGEGPLYAGTLELGRGRLRLAGSSPGLGLLTLELAYVNLAAARVGREPAERLDGAAVLVLERRQGPPLRIGSLSGPGTVQELASALAGRVGVPA